MDRYIRPANLARLHRRILLAVALGLIVILGLVLMASYQISMDRAVERADARLELQVDGLRTQLSKYRLLTPLLARRPDVLAILSSGGEDEDLEASIENLARIGAMSGVQEVELTFSDGRFLRVVGNHIVSEPSLIRYRMARSDIVEARQGRLGRWLNMGPDGRSYTFSSAVRINRQISGVVSVYVDLSETEQLWALSALPVFAVHERQIVLANLAGWHGRIFAERDWRSKAGKRDSDDFWLESSWFGPVVAHRLRPFGAEEQSRQGYIAVSKSDQLLGWTFYALEPLGGIWLGAMLALLVVSLLAGLLFVGLWVVLSRQSQGLAQRRRDLASSLRLERRVRDRTKELKQTQAGLIHSAKLAAIGQMSAVLSHEYNQPLAAIRSYADNAGLLFEMGKAEQGKDNLARIGRLVDRLANLSRSLKTFARRPGVDVKPISVSVIVDEAVMLMLPQARKQGAEIMVVSHDKGLEVMAGHTRLEQVLINLMSNALDALMEHENGQALVRIESFRRDRLGVIRVWDSGSGVNGDVRADIFEPFVTSKDKGIGLGLGLPIAFNLVKGFGGSLELIGSDDPVFATCFEVCLPLAQGAKE